MARYLPRTARLHAQISRFDKLHAFDVVPCAEHGQVQGKRNTHPHHQASPPRWRAPLHYRLCFLPIRRAVQNAEHCCPCFHSAPLADMALRRAGCAARKVTGAERTSEAPSAAGATCLGSGNAGRVREEGGWTGHNHRPRPFSCGVVVRGQRKGMCWLVSAMGSMEVFHSGTVRCNTCTRKFYSDFNFCMVCLAKARFPGLRPTHLSHPSTTTRERAR
jgi:hypothetical protein